MTSSELQAVREHRPSVEPSSHTLGDADHDERIDAPARISGFASPLPSLARRSVQLALELFASFGAAALLTWLGVGIDVDPLKRVGQVSALAGIGLYFTLAGLLLVALLHVAWRVRGGAAFDIASRVALAALSGLVTGFVAAGIAVALRGTPWCLNANIGDAGRLAQWAKGVLHGTPPPAFYPPLPIRLLALYSQWFDMPASYALKHLQIIGTALFGPLAYLSWRLVASPPWALGIGVLAALPLVDPYKPYANVVLVALVPVLASFLGWVRRAGESEYWRLAAVGGAFGAVVAGLCLTYAGWFYWSAPGALVAGVLLFPWAERAARGRAACLVGCAAIVFAALAGPFLWQATRVGFPDNFFYFDTQTDPAYFAMWRWDLPGTVGQWPPPGELGGVGLFTLILAAGIGVAIALGQGQTLVTLVGCIFAGTWVMRFWFAHRMWQTQLVQLYPRTSIELMYCALVLSGYALFLVAARRGALSESPQSRRAGPLAASLKAAPATRIGVVCALLIVLGSAGSALADRYLPANENPQSLRSLAWNAQHARH